MFRSGLSGASELSIICSRKFRLSLCSGTTVSTGSFMENCRNLAGGFLTAQDRRFACQVYREPLNHVGDKDHHSEVP
ncbi:hypothetical Protein YC6258_05287 [Gynuella sunshinyii YC6258]|uniref:Uncharacterized protein n=1 Tax=Gynuella sunshinyii YC6258 TaxID=1445510 RepID=A0A0C5VT05_9GAMM|nr:hypothetical Protein YC6258_05287 [Gynuella sunshinyii YC6258]